MSTSVVKAVTAGLLGSSGLAAYLWGGALSDRLVESTIKDLNGKCYSLSECIRVRQEGRHAQPLRDEVLGELGSMFRRMQLGDNDNVKIAIVPAVDVPNPASSGTRLLPGSHAYLVIPESVILNATLSRLRQEHAFDTLDIEPDDVHYVMNPATRYGIAHELAHIKHEDYCNRVMVALASASAAMAVKPLCIRVLNMSRRGGSIASMWAVAPTFFAYKWYSREQERLADAAAGMAGYAEGGVQYWAKQLALKNSRRTTGSAAQIEQLTLWRSHPPMGTRYASLKSMAEIVRAQANPVAAAATPAATSPPVPPAGHT